MFFLKIINEQRFSHLHSKLLLQHIFYLFILHIHPHQGEGETLYIFNIIYSICTVKCEVLPFPSKEHSYILSLNKMKKHIVYTLNMETIYEKYVYCWFETIRVLMVFLFKYWKKKNREIKFHCNFPRKHHCATNEFLYVYIFSLNIFTSLWRNTTTGVYNACKFKTMGEV